MTAVPGQRWVTLAAPPRAPRRVEGLDAAWREAHGWFARRAPRTRFCMRSARRIDRARAALEGLTDTALDERLASARERFRLGRDTSADLIAGFALASEAARRALGLRAHVEQLAGAWAIARGRIAEMATGEGKTLAATAPCVIAGWRGRGCHLFTANDYLAARDAEWMGPVYERCGVSRGCVTGSSSAEERRAAYRCDVTYATSREVAADYLRDRLAIEAEGGATEAVVKSVGADPGRHALDRLLVPALRCAIVDEADAVLIDEAVTPLIISGREGEIAPAEALREASSLARALREGADYALDAGRREVTLTNAGRRAARARLERFVGARRAEEMATQAISARALHHQGAHYVVREGRIVIVDEFTGRASPDRSWRDGMHQAIEAKEGLDITPIKETLARISYQRFFRMYDELAGMTGTARESGAELWRTYGKTLVRIPTHKPVRRRLRPAQVLACAEAKRRAAAVEIERVRAEGRPVLVGTRSVEASEALAEALAADGVTEIAVLNAVREADEAPIIARAGEPGRVTIATNMAGRGADIALGEGVARLGGLHVVLTERHESRRIDRQLFGRAGRQGDPGSGVAIIALDDELFRRFAPAWARLAGRLGAAGVTTWAAQRRAEKAAARQRASVLRSDDWLDDALGFAARG